LWKSLSAFTEVHAWAILSVRIGDGV
jgi:hypothetical protein